mmetsp:Transcript_3630/g.8037  ORF Transcript_3630/g.8037 Transcript_3630/m.8037 type:complete len:858 (+) Transcript_3630:206-2779(+)
MMDAAHHHSCSCREEESPTLQNNSSRTAQQAMHHHEACHYSSIQRKSHTKLYHIAITAITLAMMAPTIPAFTVEQSSRVGIYTRQSNSPPAALSGIMKFDAIKSRPRHHALSASVNGNNQDDDDDQDDEELQDMPPAMDGFDFEDEVILTQDDLQSMTVAQLKQQLRLRGKKVVGNKAQLVDRLLEKNTVNGAALAPALQPGYSKYQKPITSRQNEIEDKQNAEETNEKKVDDSKRVVEAKARGADIVDVTDFIEVQEVGKAFRSSDREKANVNPTIDAEVVKDDDDENEESSSSETTSSSPEVWGDDARIIDDYEGRSVVVDGLSRTVIEYTGSNNTIVQAYVVGSRESLKNFLRGGQATQKSQNDTSKPNTTPVYSSMEEEVYAIQRKRETELKRGLIRQDEVEGQHDASDPGTMHDTIERDYGDWGVYTPTGAQLSSSEVQGVLLLSDVYGPYTDNTQALADKIAFECQPVVVIVPDLFRGKPWTTDTKVDEDGVERNEDGKSYEEWRAMHPGGRVDVDIRASAAVLRERYAVASIAVWGTCYGGGRALEAAAGWYAGGASAYYEDALGDRKLPPHVDPVAAVAWYPTRYDAKKLFGKDNEGFRTFESGQDRSVAVMTIFAEDDSLPGATPEDAMLLQECLDEDPRIKDFMVKIFPSQKHGFAHANLGGGNMAESSDNKDGQGEMDRFLGEDFGSMEPMAMGGDAEVACLLSTAWMETYTRVFLPTVGTPVKFDDDEQWSALEMENGNSQKGGERRDIRSEMEESIAKFEDVNIDLGRMSQSVSPLLDGPGSEAFEEIEDEREKIRQRILDKYDISEDDDEETFDLKFQRARDDGALDELLLDAEMDGSGTAYW